jgi:simple sugar transport system ATP-binding protein
MKLELRDITKRFGAVLANDHLNITISLRNDSRDCRRKRRRQVYGHAHRVWLLPRPIAATFYIDEEVRHIRAPLDAIALRIGMVHSTSCSYGR